MYHSFLWILKDNSAELMSQVWRTVTYEERFGGFEAEVKFLAQDPKSWGFKQYANIMRLLIKSGKDANSKLKPISPSWGSLELQPKTSGKILCHWAEPWGWPFAWQPRVCCKGLWLVQTTWLIKNPFSGWLQSKSSVLPDAHSGAVDGQEVCYDPLCICGFFFLSFSWNPYAGMFQRLLMKFYALAMTTQQFPGNCNNIVKPVFSEFEGIFPQHFWGLL